MHFPTFVGQKKFKIEDEQKKNSHPTRHDIASSASDI
jgi:hypothetical protein